MQNRSDKCSLETKNNKKNKKNFSFRCFVVIGFGKNSTGIAKSDTGTGILYDTFIEINLH
jgi:hypothetical protein